MKKTLLLLATSCLLVGVFAFAQDVQTGAIDDSGATTPVSTLASIMPTTTTTNTGTICMKTAIQDRDTAVKAAMDVYSTARNTAFATRTTSFLAALDQGTKKLKRATLNATWKVFKATIKDAKKVKKDAINKAWENYRTGLKSCKVDTAKILMLERGVDDLSN